MDIAAQIRHGVEALGLSVSEHQLHQFQEIIERLEKWNRAYNLTAIRDPQQMVILHLFDSLAIAPWLKPGRLLDVGTGPGFPGIPLAILDPSRDYFLLDSNGKKTRYLKQLVYEMGLTHVTVLDTRVEQWQPDRPFDVIVSRAFASLDKMVQLTQHLLAESGVWQAMKGDRSLDEQQQLSDDVEVVAVQPLSVPQLNAERHLITLQKKLSN
jgi:16S rRNA (guanine527-N7)-methyltransferase